jgi:hypothetical protein
MITLWNYKRGNGEIWLLTDEMKQKQFVNRLLLSVGAKTNENCSVMMTSILDSRLCWRYKRQIITTRKVA